jgi:PIN domain
MPRYTTVLDACVLVPIALADTLLRVAEKGLYRPLWTDRILSEAQAAIEEVHPGIDAAKRLASMREAFDDSLITGWEDLEGGLSLPDEDDRHVVAAAIKGGAQAIITANLADFPAAALGPLGLEAVHPDDFLLDQLDLSPPTILQVIRGASRPYQATAAHPAGPDHTARQGRSTRLRRRDPPPHVHPFGRQLTWGSTRNTRARSLTGTREVHGEYTRGPYPPFMLVGSGQANCRLVTGLAGHRQRPNPARNLMSPLPVQLGNRS